MGGLIPARRRGRPNKNVPDVGPTPETVAKLQPDQLSALLARGKISPDHERAGRSLHSLTSALQRGMSPVSQLQTPSSAGKRKTAKSPLDRLSGREETAWAAIYRPWANIASQTIVARRPKLTLMDLTLRVVESNQKPRGIAAFFEMTEEQVLSRLIDGLDLYIAQEKAKKHL